MTSKEIQAIPIGNEVPIWKQQDGFVHVALFLREIAYQQALANEREELREAL